MISQLYHYTEAKFNIDLVNIGIDSQGKNEGRQKSIIKRLPFCLFPSLLSLILVYLFINLF